MGFLQDLRFALRVLWQKRLFSLLVIATLALGIGATSAMFSIVRAVLLNPLDLPELDRLAVLQEQSPRDGEWDEELSPRGYMDLVDETRSFEKLCGVQWWDASLTGDGEPEQVVSFLVSHGYFQMLGVQPALGRAFTDEEVDGKTENVVILSHRLWQRRYGGDRAVLGRQVEFNGRPFTIVGVMPDEVLYPVPAEIWAPLTFSPPEKSDRRSRYIWTIGRLKPGVSVDEATREVAAIGERHARLYPDTSAGHRLRAVTVTRAVNGELTRGFTLTLMGASLFVLLIATANVANLFLAHALSRRRELVVRTALGAGRGRIVRQLLVESALLGLLGGASSLLLAGWVVDLIKGALAPRTTRFIAGWNELGVDPAVLGLTLLLGVLVGLVFGVLPALQASRLDLAAALKDGDRGATSGPRGQRLRAALVVAQVSLALVLLVGAGALVGGFRRMADLDRGFDPERLLTVRTQLNPARYPKAPHMLEWERRALAAVEALPGIEGAKIASGIPWGELGWRRAVEVDGVARPAAEELAVQVRGVTPGYHELLRVPLLEGRHLAEVDGAAATRFAVVSARAARRMWPGESPLGKRFRWTDEGNGGGGERPWMTVVGVVGEIPDDAEAREPEPAVYLPRPHHPTRALYMVVRTSGDAEDASAAVVRALHGVDFNQPLQDVLPIDEVLAQTISGIRLGSTTMAALALLALVLAAIGIYGVSCTLVVSRTHEIGVRLALGAQRRDVMRLVVGKGMALTVVGLAVGLAMAVGLLRVLTNALTGMVDGGTGLFVVVAAGVTAVALLGSWLPARRAAAVDPMVALRGD
jgi:putative ABC transport system permease protein